MALTKLSRGLNLCVLASGEGSNLKAILKAASSGKIKSKVRLVISNNSASGALKIAKKSLIPAIHLSQKQFNSEKDFVSEFLRLLGKYKINMIVLAGYMKFLSPVIINKFCNRIINIHPALLPAFGGKGMFGINVHKAVLEYGAKLSGATVHLVDEVYDHGAIVLQKTVEVKDDDTPGTLRARILKVEHRIFPAAIKLFGENKIRVHRRKVAAAK